MQRLLVLVREHVDDVMKWTYEQESVRKVARNRYAFPEGYPAGLLMVDGQYLCSTCVKENYRRILETTRDNTCANVKWDNSSDWAAAGLVLFKGIQEDHGLVKCAHCAAVLVGPEEPAAETTAPAPEDPPRTIPLDENAYPDEENTEDNRRTLAGRVARGMELSDLTEWAKDAIAEEYKRNPDLFAEVWKDWKE